MPTLSKDEDKEEMTGIGSGSGQVRRGSLPVYVGREGRSEDHGNEFKKSRDDET